MSELLKIHFRFKPLFLLLYLTLFLTQSCGPIRLISDYDEITDQTVTALQGKVSNYFVKLERTVGTDAATYDHFADEFDAMKVDLNTLEIRSAALDKNRIMQETVVELKSMIDNLEKLHKLGFSSVEQITPLKQPFNTAFTAIAKFLLALKRGEK